MGALPSPVIAALAGLALLGPLAQSMSAAFTGPSATSPLAAVTIIVVALSGLAPFGIGSACWGIVAGLGVHGLELTYQRVTTGRRTEPVAGAGMVVAPVPAGASGGARG